MSTSSSSSAGVSGEEAPPPPPPPQIKISFHIHYHYHAPPPAGATTEDRGPAAAASASVPDGESAAASSSSSASFTALHREDQVRTPLSSPDPVPETESSPLLILPAEPETRSAPLLILGPEHEHSELPEPPFTPTLPEIEFEAVPSIMSLSEPSPTSLEPQTGRGYSSGSSTDRPSPKRSKLAPGTDGIPSAEPEATSSSSSGSGSSATASSSPRQRPKRRRLSLSLNGSQPSPSKDDDDCTASPESLEGSLVYAYLHSLSSDDAREMELCSVSVTELINAASLHPLMEGHASLIVEALDFVEKFKSFTKVSCLLCNEFVSSNTNETRCHILEKHISPSSPEMLKMFPEEAPFHWMYGDNDMEWSSLDAVSLQPSPERERVELLAQIKPLFEHTAYRSMLTVSHFQMFLQLAVCTVKPISTFSRLVEATSKVANTCICVLEAPELKTVLCFFEALQADMSEIDMICPTFEDIDVKGDEIVLDDKGSMSFCDLGKWPKKFTDWVYGSAAASFTCWKDSILVREANVKKLNATYVEVFGRLSKSCQMKRRRLHVLKVLEITRCMSREEIIATLSSSGPLERDALPAVPQALLNFIEHEQEMSLIKEAFDENIDWLHLQCLLIDARIMRDITNLDDLGRAIGEECILDYHLLVDPLVRYCMKRNLDHLSEQHAVAESEETVISEPTCQLSTFKGQQGAPGTSLQASASISEDAALSEYSLSTNEEVSSALCSDRAGLKSLGADNTCPLNAVIQALNHSKGFSKEFLQKFCEHVHTPKITCVVCELRNLFTAMDLAAKDSLSKIVNPAVLMQAVSETYGNGTLLDEGDLNYGDLNDARAVLSFILKCLHKAFVSSDICHASRQGENYEVKLDFGSDICVAHSYFGLYVREKFTCASCGHQSEEDHLDPAYFVIVDATFLGQSKGALVQKYIGTCAEDSGGCGVESSMNLCLANPPKCFVAVLNWETNVDDLYGVPDAIPVKIDMGREYSNVDTGYQRQLVSMITCHGGRTVAYVYEAKTDRWFLCQDETVEGVGDWKDVVLQLKELSSRPQMLFFDEID